MLKTVLTFFILIAIFWKLFDICNFDRIEPLKPSPIPFVNYENGTLQPRKKIAYLKTHKCSSTTILNILLRYAKKHELNVVLPESGNLIGYPNGFSIAAIRNTSWYQAGIQPDIFCLHSIWSNFSAIRDVMGPNTIYFTSIRDPIETFVSMWDFFQEGKERGMTIDEFFKLDLKSKDIKFIGYEYSLKHVLLYDFGFPSDATEEMVDQKIQEIDEMFDFIMIVEYFDESVVLLRNLLQWNFEDLSSLRLNSIKQNMKSNVSDLTRAKMKKFLQADYKLYNYFKNKFEQKMENIHHSSLMKDLEKFRQIQNKIKSKCPFELVPRNTLPIKDQPWSPVAESYKMLNENPECELIGMQERTIIDLVRREQNERIAKLQN